MRFPRERLLFVVDWIPVKAIGFRDWPDAYIEDWIESLRRVEAMDFDQLVPGHGPIGTKADVRAFREYMEELRAEVLLLAREGKTEQEVVQALKLPKYEGLANYKEMFPLNVAGMYRHVQMHRVRN
jgi:glyoxylase-like metal-dependent hydrolase (beta-lactamase superfamily II)